MSSRRRLLPLLVLLVVFAHPQISRAACTIVPGAIPNFRTISFTNNVWTMGWDPPAGSTGATYQVMGETGNGYCHFPRTYSVLTTTTSTSYTANLSTPNITYGFLVQLASDPCVRTAFEYVTDTFTNVPDKPATPTVAVNSSNVTLTFNYSDDKSFGVGIYRAGADGKYTFAGFVSTCQTNPKSFTDKNVPAGTYSYRLTADDAAGVTNSDPVTVTIGAPAIVSFSATPPLIRAGQTATLSWVTQGATFVTIDNGVGAAGPSGSITVAPAATTTYTLTANGSGGTATATAAVQVITTPVVVLSSPPGAMVQSEGTGGATSSYTLTNAGGAATTVTLGQRGTFFTQSPTTFSLAPGASQVVTITGLPSAAGPYPGASLPSGVGVQTGMSIPINLLVTAPPAGTVTAKPATNRVDVAGAAGSSPTGTVNFTNSGTATLTGILVSDVPWIIPQPGVISIPPGATVPVTFTIDRSQRPDADSLAGSAAGNLSLTYLTGDATPSGDVTPAPSISIVTVVDTVQLSVASGTPPPPLVPGEVALFVPGAGHVSGTVGTFISDISVLNPPGNKPINDIRFFFTPAAAGAQSSSTTLPPVGNVSFSLADVVKTVFAGDGQLGSLQIRSGSASKISVNTSIFNTSNPAGTYGTTIPTFRSDRAVGSGDHLVLTGLRQDATGHTNIFIQETSGTSVAVQTEFLDANGTTLGTRTDGVGAFGLARFGGVPNGAVAAILTNQSSGNATFLAYATPVDDASGDNWSIVDWSRHYGYSGSSPVIIPVAGVLQGANNTFFRTDAVITNTGTASGSGTLRFYPRGGTPVDRQITLGGRQTSVLTNVIGSLFNAANGSVGYLLFTPSTGTFAITSRTYTTVAGSVATFGTHVPTVPASSSMLLGSLRAIGTLQDAAVPTIVAARPATFRTNFGILETSGNSVTVRVTLRYSYSAGVKVQAFGSASKDYALNPNEFRQLNGIAGEILGAGRSTLGDLRDMEADFEVVGGSGAVVIYTSSTDNGTGDVILRME